MKQFFTLVAAAISCTAINAQLVLNELYTDPGNGKHEFFELYNTGIAPESANNYALVTYFNSASLGSGFYVLDLPNMTVAGKGFLVGSSKSPFNYQGVSNSTRTNFDWNDNTWLSNNDASLTGWRKGATNLLDGNLFYDKISLAAGFNDLFYHLSGSGSSYVVFLYKNGMLVNSLIGGAGGHSTIPAEIAALPDLSVSLLGLPPTFTINFAPYSTLPVEPINPDAGSDNGFTRTIDGACGTWGKSSSQVNHTPQQSNGSITTSSSGTVDVSALIARGTAATGSVLTYKVVSAAATDLPVVMNVYLDNGTVPGELDIADVLLTSTTTSTVGQSYQYTFFPYNANILVITKNGAGCIDNMKMAGTSSILPVKLNSFSATIENARARLYWTVSENETGYMFELQSSTDGRDFGTAAVIFTTNKSGDESYAYKESKQLSGSVYYRLKIVNKDNSISYSKIIRLSAQTHVTSKLRMTQNPVESDLNFTYDAITEGSSIITVYNTAGVKLYSSQVLCKKGLNTISLLLTQIVTTGTYILEVANNNDRSTTKFIKR